MANDDAYLKDPANMSFTEAMQAHLAAEDAGVSAAPSSPGGTNLMSDTEAASITQNISEVSGVLGSIATGAAKGVIEAKDFVSGMFGNSEPNWDDKWAVRQYIEQKAGDLKREGVVNGIAQSLAQFGVGFIGLGKMKYVKDGLEAAKGLGRGAHLAAESLRGAAAAGIVMDPHEDRLSNLVEAYPALSNPISNYLAAKPTDSAAEGRLKNALEGIVMDTVLVGAMAAVARGVKFFRAGDLKGRDAAYGEADTLFAKANKQDSPEQTAILSRDSETARIPQTAEGEVADVRTRVRTESALSGEHPDGVVLAGDGSRAEPPAGGNTPGQHPGIGAGNGNIEGTLTSTRLDHSASGLSEASSAARETVAPQTVIFTDEEIALALSRLRSDQEAIAQHGTRDAAIDAGYKFRGNEGAGIIPWQKLRTTDDIQAWMGQLIESQSKFINKVRGGNADGVLKDAHLDRIIAERSRDWGDDPAKLRGIIEQSGKEAPDIAANMEMSFRIANQAFQDAYELAKRIQSDNYTGFGSRGEALAALQHQMATATTMYATGKSIITNSARAMRRMRGEFRITDEQLAGLRTSDPEELAHLVVGTQGNPKALTKLATYGLAHRIIDAATGFQAANLLWGWKTQVVNAASSAAMLVWRPLEVTLGATGKQSVAALRGDKAGIAAAAAQRRQAIRETTYLKSTLMDGWSAGVEAFLRGNSRLIPYNAEQFNVANSMRIGEGDLRTLTQAWVQVDGPEAIVKNLMTSASVVLGGSLRAMGAADEMFKTMRYRAIVTAKASVEADAQGIAAGTQPYKDFITKRLDAAFDDAGRGLDQAALAEAKASTFQQDLPSREDTWLGGWAKGYSVFASQTPAVKLITPFIKTPTNLIRYGVRLTPGAQLLQREFTDALIGTKGAEEQARAVGQMMLSVSFLGIASMMFAEGRLTGSGPKDPQQAAEWRKLGNKPYSVTWIDEEGKKQYLELNRFDPVAMPFQLVADFQQLRTSGLLSEDDEAGLATTLMLAMSHLLKEKTYLRNISEGIKALIDDRTTDQWARRFAPGLLPMSTLAPMLNDDDVMHEVRSTTDAIMNRIPGLSATLPPQRDIFGEVVKVPSGFVSSQRDASPIMHELDRLFAKTGRFVDPASPRRPEGVDLRDFKLASSGRVAYDRYQELVGKPDDDQPSLKEALNELIASPEYRDILVDGQPTLNGTRSGAILDVVAKYRMVAFDRLKMESPELVERLSAPQRGILDAIQKREDYAGSKAADGLGDFLRGYGLTTTRSGALH